MSTKHFIFDHGGFQYAVNVMDVVEIVAVESIVPFHGEFRGCHGCIAHRDLLIPILDATAVTAGTNIVSEPKLVVILNYDDVIFALTLDEYITVYSFADAEYGSHRQSGMATGTVLSQWVENTRGFRDKTLVILAVSELAKSVQARIGDQRITSDNARPDVETRHVKAGELGGNVYMCARIEQCLFAVDVADVLELIEEVDVTPLFKVTPAVRGLINLRGQVLACIDISTQLGYAPRVFDEQSQFIVMQCDDANLALCVDEVTGIRHLTVSGFQKSDTAISVEMSRYLSGILEEDDRRTYLLAVRGIFDSPDLEPYRNVDG